MTVGRFPIARAIPKAVLDTRIPSVSATTGGGDVATTLSATIDKQADESKLLVFESSSLYTNGPPGQVLRKVFVDGVERDTPFARRLDDTLVRHASSTLRTLTGIAKGSRTVTTKFYYNGPAGKTAYIDTDPAHLLVVEMPVGVPSRAATGPAASALRALNWSPGATVSTTSTAWADFGPSLSFDKKQGAATNLAIIFFGYGYTANTGNVAFAIKTGFTDTLVAQRDVNRAISHTGFAGACILTGLSAGTSTLQVRAKVNSGNTLYMNASSSIGLLIVECV